MLDKQQCWFEFLQFNLLTNGMEQASFVVKINTRSYYKSVSTIATCVVQGRSSKEPCSYCGRNFSDQLHFIHSCNKYAGTRELYWSIIVNIFDVNISTYLYNLPENELTEVILGRRPDLEISDDQWQALLVTCAQYCQIYVMSLRSISINSCVQFSLVPGC